MRLAPASPTTVEQRGERAGAVVERDPEAGEPAAADEAPLDDRREQPGVDVAAGEHDADAPAGEPLGVGGEGGDAGGARPLDDDLLDLEQAG